MPSVLDPQGPISAFGWTVFSASAVGAHHLAVGLPCEDAVLTTRGVTTVLAVSDGHGHQWHFRSRRGSAFAVEVAQRTGEEWSKSWTHGGGTPTEEELHSQLLPLVWRRWIERVEADVAADPFTVSELADQHPSNDPVFAYGATLLFAIITAQWIVVAQIGDGDVVVADQDQSGTPLPDDRELDGTRTTSLCQRDALRSFRGAVLKLMERPVLAVMLATDGYGNAQSDESWRETAGRQLLKMRDEKGAEWMGRQLQSLVQRCASADGSGDDTTVAIALAAERDALTPLPERRLARHSKWPATGALVLALAGVSVGLGLGLSPGSSSRSAHTSHTAPNRGTDSAMLTSPSTLLADSKGVIATLPGTSRPISVGYPLALGNTGAVAAIQEGDAVYVLARDGRLWRLPVPSVEGAPGIASSPILRSPVPPLRYLAGRVTIGGDAGRVTFRVDVVTMAVTCWTAGVGPPTRIPCALLEGGDS